MSRAAASSLQQALRHQRIDSGHTRDVDNRDQGAGLHDLLQETLHHHLGPLTVESADEGQRENVFPQLHHRGQLHHFALLPLDELLAAFHERFNGQQPQPVQQAGGAPDLFSEPLGTSAKPRPAAGRTAVAWRDKTGGRCLGGRLKPRRARERDTRARKSRTGAQLGPIGLGVAAPLDCSSAAATGTRGLVPQLALLQGGRSVMSWRSSRAWTQSASNLSGDCATILRMFNRGFACSFPSRYFVNSSGSRRRASVTRKREQGGK